MTVFLLLAATMLAIVTLVLLLPLLRRHNPAAAASAEAVNIGIYRDQLRELEEDLAAGTIDRSRYDEARAEIERRLLDDTRSDAAPASPPKYAMTTAVALAVLVPVAAGGIYLAVGSPEALSPQSAESAHGVTPQQVEQMIARLSERLKEQPENAEGWAMLGRSYAALDRFGEAATAYAEAVKRLPDDPQLLVDYADVLARSRGRNLLGEPEGLISRALALDPANGKALALAGTVAFQKKQYPAAVAHWQKLVAMLPPGSEMVTAIQDSIAEARSLAGGAKPRPGPAAATAARVTGTVRLSDALKSRAAPGDTVFIFARAANGSPAPLAILRRQVSDLPAEFVLDDTLAMAPGLNLSSVSEVIVGARISKSGTASRRPGDLEGFSSTVKTGATGLVVVIDTEVR
jgi:cytochrome c-type biogenesis protein CcmH